MRRNEDFYEQLGRRIAGLRKSLGLSQEKLGEQADVGSSYIAHIEIGSRKPTLDVLLRIADAVEAPLWRLLTDDRLTPDEKAWDATARGLAESVRGLPQPDVQALSHLAARIKSSDSRAGSRAGSAATATRVAERPSTRRLRAKRTR